MRSATGVACPSSTSFKVSFEPSDSQNSIDNFALARLRMTMPTLIIKMFTLSVRIKYSTKAVCSDMQEDAEIFGLVTYKVE